MFVVSQEALLHVPDKQRTLLEAFRILKPQGRIAFTDWVAHRPLGTDRKLMWQGMAVADLYSLQTNADIIRSADFTVCSIEDLTGAA